MSHVNSRIRTNDLVQVIAGREGGRLRAEGEDGEKLRGRRGRVLDIDRERGRAFVEGRNLVYKHQRRSQDPTQPNAGRIQVEASIALSNLMLVCPKCEEATRVGIREEQQETENGKARTRRIRVCKRCDADIPERVG
jgi:large subunit ribosomal protein L24